MDHCWKRMLLSRRYSVCYFIMTKKVIILFERSCGYEYRGYTFSKNGDMFFHSDENFQILRLKCIVKAIELGWKIKHLK